MARQNLGKRSCSCEGVEHGNRQKEDRPISSPSPPHGPFWVLLAAGRHELSRRRVERPPPPHQIRSDRGSEVAAVVQGSWCRRLSPSLRDLARIARKLDGSDRAAMHQNERQARPHDPLAAVWPQIGTTAVSVWLPRKADAKERKAGPVLACWGGETLGGGHLIGRRAYKYGASRRVRRQPGAGRVCRTSSAQPPQRSPASAPPDCFWTLPPPVVATGVPARGGGRGILVMPMQSTTTPYS